MNCIFFVKELSCKNDLHKEYYHSMKDLNNHEGYPSTSKFLSRPYIENLYLT